MGGGEVVESERKKKGKKEGRGFCQAKENSKEGSRESQGETCNEEGIASEEEKEIDLGVFHLLKQPSRRFKRQILRENLTTLPQEHRDDVARGTSVGTFILQLI